MGPVQKLQTVAGRIAVVVAIEEARRHGVVEDEARAADQVPRRGVVDAAVVAEMLKEPARSVDAARMIEGHDAFDMRDQKRGIAEPGVIVGHGSDCWTRVHREYWASV